MSKKKIYRLVFEFYNPSVAWVEVEASNLDEAMKLAQEIDDDELDFENDYNNATSTRLFGVETHKEGFIALLKDDGVAGIEEDLRSHWKKGTGIKLKEERA